MLVVNERNMPGPEQCVLEWIRTWNGQYVIVGLAVSGYPSPNGNNEDPRGATDQTDVMVITPRAVVVIEARNTDAESVPRRDNDPFDLSQLVRRQHPDAFVDRLVVVPPGETAVTSESRKSGDTVVGSSPELRAWFLRTANRKLIWTAEQAYELLGELGLSHVVTVEELVAEGFPSQTGRPKRRTAKVLVPAYASVAAGAVALPDDARLSSERSSDRAAYPPWLPTEIDEKPSESVALSRSETEPRALVSAPAQPTSQPVDHPDAIQPQSAPQLSSEFTDSWSSWIESDESLDEPAPRRDLDRRGRSQREPRLRNWLSKPISPILVATAAPRNQPRASVAQEPGSAESPQRWTETGSLPDIAPQPLSTAPIQPPVTVGAPPVSEDAPPRSSTFEAQPPTKAARPVRLSQPGNAPAARPHRASASRLVSEVRRSFVAVAATGMKLIAGLPQLLATAVVVGAIFATTWLLISEGMHPKPAVVEPRPESGTEPAGQLKLPATSEPPAAQCFPLQQQC